MRWRFFGNNFGMTKSLNTNCFQKTLLDAINLKICSRENERSKDDEDDVFLKKSIVVVAFGTPLISGDAYAPLVASALKEDFDVPVFAYGTTEHPVNAKNMTEWLDFVKTVHKDSLILAIDASLGEKVGSVVVRKDGVCPAAVKGRKKRFGDVGVLGVVGSAKGDALVNLMSADFDFVQNMALDTAKSIADTVGMLF